MELKEVGLMIVIIMSLCQSLKVAGLGGRWIPLVGVILGIVGGIYFGGTNYLEIIAGVLIGLSTGGLYDLVRKTFLNK